MEISVELATVFIIFGIAAIVVLSKYIIKISSSNTKIENAKQFIKIKDFNKAISTLKSIISRNSVNSEAHYLLGECYFISNNYEWAMPEYKKVLQLNKYDKEFNEIIVRRRIANIYLYYKQLEEAQKEFALITKLDPNNHENYYEMGKIFVERGHIDKAKPYIQKALTINPNHANSLYYMGFINFKMKLFNEALTSLVRCVAIDTEYTKAYYYIGIIKFQSRNYQDALKNLSLSIKNYELRIDSLYQRGMIFINLNEMHHAQDEFEKALMYSTEENNNTLNIRYQLANCYEIKKELSDAIEQWEKIISVQPNFLNVQDKLKSYSELRMDDKLKDFFIASNEEFKKKAKQILQKLNLEVVKLDYIQSTSIEFITEEKLGSSKDVRVQKILVRIYRNNDPLGEKIMRDITDKIKSEAGVQRGLCISAAGYTKQAKEFADIRPLDMLGNKELSKLLKEIN